MADIVKVFNFKNNYQVTNLINKLNIDSTQLSNFIQIIAEGYDINQTRKDVLDYMSRESYEAYMYLREVLRENIENKIGLNDVLELKELVQNTSRKLDDTLHSQISDLISKKASANISNLFFTYVKDFETNKDFNIDLDLMVDGKNFAYAIFNIKNDIKSLIDNYNAEPEKKPTVAECFKIPAKYAEINKATGSKLEKLKEEYINKFIQTGDIYYQEMVFEANTKSQTSKLNPEKIIESINNNKKTTLWVNEVGRMTFIPKTNNDWDIIHYGKVYSNASTNQLVEFVKGLNFKMLCEDFGEEHLGEPEHKDDEKLYDDTVDKFAMDIQDVVSKDQKHLGIKPIKEAAFNPNMEYVKELFDEINKDIGREILQADFDDIVATVQTYGEDIEGLKNQVHGNWNIAYAYAKELVNNWHNLDKKAKRPVDEASKDEALKDYKLKDGHKLEDMSIWYKGKNQGNFTIDRDTKTGNGETVWKDWEDGEDDGKHAKCSWCGEYLPKNEMRYEKKLGWLCRHCGSGLESREGKLDWDDDIEECTCAGGIAAVPQNIFAKPIKREDAKKKKESKTISFAKEALDMLDEFNMSINGKTIAYDNKDGFSVLVEGQIANVNNKEEFIRLLEMIERNEDVSDYLFKGLTKEDLWLLKEDIDPMPAETDANPKQEGDREPDTTNPAYTEKKRKLEQMADSGVSNITVDQIDGSGNETASDDYDIVAIEDLDDNGKPSNAIIKNKNTGEVRTVDPHIIDIKS